MKYRFLILAFIFAICALAANADTYTDGIAKRIADGQSELVLADSPIIDDIFDRTFEQRKQGVIEYIASIFRKHMSEKEFKAWMEYKPSKDEVEYEKSLKEMQDLVQQDRHEIISSDSIRALLMSGKDVQIIQAKPCSESYRKAFDRYAEANGIFMVCEAKKMLAGFTNAIDSAQVDPVTQRAWDIWEKNTMNSILNAYIDHCTESQLKEFSRELPFSKQIDEITIDYLSNIVALFEAAFGVNINDVEGLVDKKTDYLVNKYGHQTVDFNVAFKGILRTYTK